MKSLTSVVIKNSKRRELTNTSRALTVFAFLIVAGFLSIIMIVFSYITTKRLNEIGQPYAFINMLFLMNFIILFSESIFQSLNTLYFSKDLNTFLRLPIKPKDLVRAKLKDMIISQYEMEILMLAIPTITYGIMYRVTAIFYFYLFVILLILPIIPISITTCMVSVVMRCTNFIKNKSKVMYITIIISLLLLTVVLGGFNRGKENLSVLTFEKIILQADGLANEISNRFILVRPIMNTLLEYDNIVGAKNILMYIGETIIIYEVMIFIISKIYLKGAIGTVINGKKYKNKLEKLDEKDLKIKNMENTYFNKELKIICRTPIFLIQCIIMPIIYPVLTTIAVIAILNFTQKIDIEIMNNLNELIRNGIGFSAFLAIGQGFFMLSFSSIIAMSKDGKSAVIQKSFPISLEKQFKIKTKIGVMVNSLSSVIICIAYFYFVKNFILTIIMFLCMQLLNIFGERWKLLVDLKNPQIKWDTEYIMLKQNTNVMYELFYTLIVIIGIVFVGVLFSSTQFVSTVSLSVLVLMNVVLEMIVHKNVRSIFGKVY